MALEQHWGGPDSQTKGCWEWNKEPCVSEKRGCIDHISQSKRDSEADFGRPGAPCAHLLSDTIALLYLYLEPRPEEMSWRAN